MHRAATTRLDELDSGDQRRDEPDRDRHRARSCAAADAGDLVGLRLRLSRTARGDDLRGQRARKIARRTACTVWNDVPPVAAAAAPTPDAVTTTALGVTTTS